jgi:hypothetical protein
MAHQFVLGRNDTGQQVRIGHGHCPECGACLIGGLTKSNHNCQARPLDKDVLRVMVAEMRSTDEKTRQVNRTAFARELEEYGFNVRA